MGPSIHQQSTDLPLAIHPPAGEEAQYHVISSDQVGCDGHGPNQQEATSITKTITMLNAGFGGYRIRHPNLLLKTPPMSFHRLQVLYATVRAPLIDKAYLQLRTPRAP